MLSQVHYLIRSKIDGKYLAPRPQTGQNEREIGYLLIFREHFDALSYLNTHGSDVADRFAVESISAIQLKGLLQRWGFDGIALVKDPLLPQIEFLSYG
ncbi:MAG: hypothetical protein F6K10_26760 [Moorea sp. SIO2B7]|nr:hypothetical protein [Moorena sp. SIO2B7]